MFQGIHEIDADAVIRNMRNQIRNQMEFIDGCQYFVRETTKITTDDERKRKEFANKDLLKGSLMRTNINIIFHNDLSLYIK